MRDFAGKAAYSNPSYSSAGGVVAATLQDSMQTVGLVVQGNSSWVSERAGVRRLWRRFWRGCVGTRAG
jgi:hypothetical protein